MTLRVPVELWLALVFMAVAFTGGFLVRGMSDRQPAQPVVGSVQGTDAGQVIQAPPLTSDQLSGNLPAGHPDIGDASVPSEPGQNGGGNGGGGNGGNGGNGGGNGS